MAERDRVEEGNEALDPELLFSKEYCIGWSPLGEPAPGGRALSD